MLLVTLVTTIGLGLDVSQGWGEKGLGLTADSRVSSDVGSAGVWLSSMPKYTGSGFIAVADSRFYVKPAFVGGAVHYRSGGSWSKTSIRPEIGVRLSPDLTVIFGFDVWESAFIKSHVKTVDLESWTWSGRFGVGVVLGAGTYNQGQGNHMATSVRVMGAVRSKS